MHALTAASNILNKEPWTKRGGSRPRYHAATAAAQATSPGEVNSDWRFK